jgi:outer membrane receptor for ferric coprogen and ferric-rhodotorulic acid
LAPGYQPYPGGPVFCAGLTCPAGSIRANPPIDVFDFDPTDPLYTEPRNPLPNLRYSKLGQVQSGAYINLRLTAFDRLHLTTGLRWSRYESKTAYDLLCTNTTGACAGKAIGDVSSTSDQHYSNEDLSWPPPVNLSFDVTKSLTAYAGYTDIYRSQANRLDASNKPLPPVTGSNWEAGIKWAARDGRFNLSLAAYQIRQKGFAAPDPDFPDQVEVQPGILCCYLANPNRTIESKGIDAELTGELRPGWQVAASYTFNKNEQKGSSFGSSEGLPLLSIQPRHLYKLWMSYDFGAAGYKGSLSGLTLSGGVNGQSSAYRSGSICVRFIGIPNPITGAQSCAPNTDPANPSRVDYRFTVPAYALLSARIDYRFSEAWSLAVNLENILDKTYYQTTSFGVIGGHWYGAPRSFMGTLRAKW